jgi:hypothetical protein
MFSTHWTELDEEKYLKNKTSLIATLSKIVVDKHTIEEISLALFSSEKDVNVGELFLSN